MIILCIYTDIYVTICGFTLYGGVELPKVFYSFYSRHLYISGYLSTLIHLSIIYAPNFQSVQFIYICQLLYGFSQSVKICIWVSILPTQINMEKNVSLVWRCGKGLLLCTCNKQRVLMTETHLQVIEDSAATNGKDGFDLPVDI